MDIYLTEPVSPFHTAAGASFGNFTTKKSVDPLPVPVIPGGKLRRGSKIYLHANGEFSTTGTPNLTLGFWFGTRALSITGDIALSSVIATTNNSANFPWSMYWEGHVNSDPGTAATLIGGGMLFLGTALTTFANPVPIPITQALRTVSGFDTTIERALGVSATWGTANAANTVVVNNLRGLILN